MGEPYDIPVSFEEMAEITAELMIDNGFLEDMGHENWKEEDVLEMLLELDPFELEETYNAECRVYSRNQLGS